MQHSSLHEVFIVVELNEFVFHKHEIFLLKVRSSCSVQVLRRGWWSWWRLNTDSFDVMLHIVELNWHLVECTTLLWSYQVALHFDILVLIKAGLLFEVMFFKNEWLIFYVILLLKNIAEFIQRLLRSQSRIYLLWLTWALVRGFFWFVGVAEVPWDWIFIFFWFFVTLWVHYLL